MTPLATVMLWIFNIAIPVGIAAWFYTARYFLPMWAVGFKRREHHSGYWRRTGIGSVAFLAAIGTAFAAGAVAELAGGW